MKSTPWIVPTLAGLFIGFGIFSVFLQCLNYIIDAYLMFAASAIAANTIMRSLFGAIFPLFAVSVPNCVALPLLADEVTTGIHVQRDWYQLGYDTSRLRCRALHTNAILLPLLWQEYPSQVEVRSGAGH